jgi:protein-S-isoprenylcysteine O-methyltransferase Ste14
MKTAGLKLASLLAVALYFGLAIYGRGGFVAFFSVPALVALALSVGVLSVAALFTGGNLSPGEREDRANRWVIPVIGLVQLLDTYLPAYCDRRALWVIDGDGVRWFGVALFGAGGWLRVWPVFVLGDRFSGLVAIQPGHRLVTDGVYRTIRNPSYLGLLVNTLGWGLAFRSAVGVALWAFLIPPLVVRITAEERLLRSEFGAAYDSYCGRTRRLIPGIY